MNDKPFVKDYDTIKEQLKKLEEKYNTLCESKNTDTLMMLEKYKISNLLVALSWVLSDVNEDL